MNNSDVVRLFNLLGKKPSGTTWFVLSFLFVAVYLLAVGTLPDTGPEATILGDIEGAQITLSDGRYKVTEVIDGDTLKIKTPTEELTVRLLGIDTPESKRPGTPIECFSHEATEKLASLVLDERVFLESDSSQADRDRYNRLLRYVYLEDGKNVNLVMVKRGFAHEYTYQDNPYQQQRVFRAAEYKAREGERGLWSDDNCPQ
ncbi:MAG: thermonuclease family protein [Candidatus Dojkabacteria bacterium]